MEMNASACPACGRAASINHPVDQTTPVTCECGVTFAIEPDRKAAEETVAVAPGARRRRWTSAILTLAVAGVVALVSAALTVLYDPDPRPGQARLLASAALVLSFLALVPLSMLQGLPVRGWKALWGPGLGLLAGLWLVAMVEGGMAEPPEFPGYGPAAGYWMIMLILVTPFLTALIVGRLWVDSREARPLVQRGWRTVGLLILGVGWFSPGMIAALTFGEPNSGPVLFWVVALGVVVFLGLFSYHRGRQAWQNGGDMSYQNLLLFLGVSQGLVSIHLVLRADALATKAQEAFRKASPLASQLVVIALLLGALALARFERYRG